MAGDVGKFGQRAATPVDELVDGLVKLFVELVLDAVDYEAPFVATHLYSSPLRSPRA